MLDQRKAARTEVFDMKDEIMLDGQKHPLGIRLTYKMRFPNSDYFSHSPFVTTVENLKIGFGSAMVLYHREVNPPLEGDPTAPRFRKDQLYEFTTDLIPGFLGKSKSDICINIPTPPYDQPFHEFMKGSETKSKLRIAISGTKFVSESSQVYDLKDFYDTAVQQGAKDCPTFN
jgi:hypothetical protein